MAKPIKETHILFGGSFEFMMYALMPSHAASESNLS